jgi:predicted membrane protein
VRAWGGDFVENRNTSAFSNLIFHANMLLKIFLFNNILKLLFFIFLNLFLLSTQQTTHKNTKKKKKI